MTSKNDPNLSRLKCIGYKYGYDEVEVYELFGALKYSNIFFIKNINFDNIAEYQIRMPFKVIDEYVKTNDFDIIANYVEEYLKQSTELDMHYV